MNMGKVESATASIGIKINMRDLLVQLCDSNQFIIKDMLMNGFIEDDDNDFNEEFRTIVDKKIHLDWVKLKDYLYSAFSKSVNNLLDAVLLFPMKCILTTERWDREGMNGISRDLNFDLLLPNISDLEHTERVFILCQNSG